LLGFASQFIIFQGIGDFSPFSQIIFYNVGFNVSIFLNLKKNVNNFAILPPFPGGHIIDQ
jgi:hypothetical protein